jgi:CubicO group peptidase (beta-lactamase class C family)
MHDLSFHDWLEQQVQQYRLPGMAGVLIRDRVAVIACAGYADLEAQIPVTPSTPFLLSSLTKPLSAILMMRMAAQGFLDLDAPIRRYYRDYDVFCDRLKRYARDGVEPAALFRNYNGGEYDITVRHHMTHTAQGIPGTRFFYNGFLFGILSRVVETVARTPYATVFADDLIRPYDLKNTSPHTSGVTILPLQESIARSYYRRVSGMFRRSEFPEVAFNASAGLVASIEDLATLDQALDAGELLSREDRDQIWTSQRLRNGNLSPYGLGWYVSDYQGNRLCWHTGWWDASSSAIYLKMPAQRMTLILLANSDGLRWSGTEPYLTITESPVIRSFFSTLM